MKPVARPGAESRAQVAAAIHRNKALSREGALERLFSFAFSTMVYPQIWEDPVVDMEALDIRRTDNIVAIASGGCNIASYLTAHPQKIVALDLNTAHIALNKLKLEAARRLPGHAEFRSFFGNAADPQIPQLYKQWIAPHLDSASRAYWEARPLLRRQRIDQFSLGFYRHGLLGRFIGFGHMMMRLYGVDPGAILKAKTLDEQKAIYEHEIAPLFKKRLLRWMANQPASLYGLGIPPAQYKALAADHEEGMIGALRQRVEKLACGFPLQHNYFAQQAFSRSYGHNPDQTLPPYLQAEHFDAVRTGAERVEVRQQAMTDFLSSQSAASFNCFVLLDAQDWMNDADLNALWAQITRAARPGARVIFRTAADEKLLPGRVSEDIFGLWQHDEVLSKTLHARDRSAIYGAFHLYELRNGERD